jgi:mannose-1-phosphate guanylyltransferase
MMRFWQTGKHILCFFWNGIIFFWNHKIFVIQIEIYSLYILQKTNQTVQAKSKKHAKLPTMFPLYGLIIRW